MTEKSICAVCKFPERDKSSGTITHWILSCTCGQDTSQSREIQVILCRACGKRIGKGRDGSITQYVFWHDTCACHNPVAYKGAIALKKEQLVKHYYEVDSEEDDEELALAVERFPTDRLKPLAELGRGAFGVVWLARDKLLKKRVAVKVLYATDGKSLKAFQEEARAISLLRHPNIVEIVDFGLIDSAIPYMVLEYVPGLSLERLLRRERVLDWKVAIVIATQVCDALIYAHDRGIFHRDIQPGNILVIEQDSATPIVKLIDFGISKFCANSDAESGTTLAGSPLYMSPDVGLGRPYSASSEVYSLGCVLFELLSGRPPYIADSALQLLSMHANDEIPTICATLLPTKLNQVVGKAMDKEPGSRYQSVRDLKDELMAVAAEESEHLSASEPLEMEGEKTKPRPSNNRLLWSLVGILIISVGTWAVFYTSEPNPGPGRLKSKRSASQKPVLSLPKVEGELYAHGVIGKKWEVDGNILRTLDACDNDLKFLTFVDERDLANPRKVGSVESVSSKEAALLKVPKTVDCLEITVNSSVNEGLRYLCNHNFSRIDINSPRFDDRGASLIPLFHNLRSLHISRTARLGDKGLSDIMKAPNLAAIRIRWMTLPPNTCKIIATSKSICSVNLGHSDGLRLNDFKYLSGNPGIKSVKVAATKISDSWADEIKKMNLEVLHINENDDFTDAGLLKVGQIKTLQEIRLTVGKGITQNGVSYLRQRLPKCRIVEN